MSNKVLKVNNKVKTSSKKSTSSFYNLKTEMNNNSVLDFEYLKNKKILIVNTASECGYTQQYESLQQLHTQMGERLTIIGFPSNDFAKQEQRNDNQIEEFCKINFGVTFLLAKKSGVLKNETQNEVFKWLTSKEQNGWNDSAPKWNFCKYLIDETGNLIGVYQSGVNPLKIKELFL
ncbi:MAG: glutathione peroxidase [Ferruginibacter sp.]